VIAHFGFAMGASTGHAAYLDMAIRARHHEDESEFHIHNY